MRSVDFGLCLDLSDIGATDEAVKNGIHVAPEKLYSEKSDVYSLGLVVYGECLSWICLFILICGSELLSLVDLSRGTLYEMNTTLLSAERVRVTGQVRQVDSLLPQYEPVKALVGEMLIADPKTRPSALTVVHRISVLLGRVAGVAARCA